jgi:hypothetical protein
VLRKRPSPTVWSVLEYAAHTATVLELHSLGVSAITTVDDLPPIPAPDWRDAAADDPAFTEPTDEVFTRLGENARQYERLAARTTDGAWERKAHIGESDLDAGWLLRHSVHDASHHLSDAGRVLRALDALDGVGARGEVAGLFASGGGVPKHSIDEALIGARGVAGDRQAERQHHGRVWQALCLWSADVVDALRAEGHPIEPGRAGENVSVRGLDWTLVRPGVRMAIGDVLAEVSAYSAPCKKNAEWFTGGNFRRMGHDGYPGSSRVYASVLRDGAVRAGDGVVLEP